MADISLKHVMKKYAGGDAAVKDLNLELRNGELLALTGPSGSGKSTILHMIAGLEEPSEGVIMADGENMDGMTPRERDLAMIFQNNMLYPDMTIYENLEFGLKMRKVSPQVCEERIEKTAEMLGLTAVLQRKPGEIDDELCQKTAIGRAIVHHPKALLLDEPFLNLDSELRKKMQKELERLHRELELTILYVTEDPEEAMKLGDRVAVMRNGILQQADKPENIYENPVNLFVAGFFGNPRMNFLECDVREKNAGGEITLFFEDRALPVPDSLAALLRENGLENRKVLAGLRPEDLCLGAPDGNCLQASVCRYGTVGNKIYVYFELGDMEGAVLVDRQTAVKPGDTIGLIPDMTKLHIFDKETGAAVTAGTV